MRNRASPQTGIANSDPVPRSETKERTDHFPKKNIRQSSTMYPSPKCYSVKQPMSMTTTQLFSTDFNLYIIVFLHTWLSVNKMIRFVKCTNSPLILKILKIKKFQKCNVFFQSTGCLLWPHALHVIRSEELRTEFNNTERVEFDIT